ncbi:DUF6809 domain-containing protein, partial [Dysosmobacter welbionis]
VQLILGGAGDHDVHRHFPGPFAGEELHAEAVGVRLHLVGAAGAHGQHEIELLLGADAVGIVDIAVRPGEGDHLAAQLRALAAHAPGHV